MMPKNNFDDITPSEPPPTYDEAVSQSSTGNSYGASSQAFAPQVPPPQPPRPSNNPASRPTAQAPQLPQRPSNAAQGLYTSNPNLPFQYPKGYLCSKCKNTGYKIRNGSTCRLCWDKFYLNNHGYNPNPQLPFKYPRKYLCEKCYNTGYKLKNGRSCKDCWELFSPRNYCRPAASSVSYNPFDGFFGSSTTQIIQPSFNPGGPNGYPSSLPPIRVPPGDPRLGGVLCGRCRGSGITHFLLDEDLCSVCRGLGRVISSNNAGPSQFVPQMQPPPSGMQQPQLNNNHNYNSNGPYIPPRKN